MSDAVEAEVKKGLAEIGELRAGDVVTDYVIISVVHDIETGDESVVLTDSAPTGRTLPTWRVRGMIEEAALSLLD